MIFDHVRGVAYRGKVITVPGLTVDELRAANARLLAVLKTIAEEPDGPWKTTLAWQAYKRETSA